MKKYYAIKVGKNAKDLIVEGWKECKKYVIDYPAIYKGFISKKNAQKYLENITEEDVKYKLEIAEGQRYKRLKRMIQQCFDFEIPENVMRALIYYESEERLYASIDFAIISKKISEDDANFFKYTMKEVIKELNYRIFIYKYHNEKIVDLKKYFNNKNLANIRKLDIEIKDEIYTEYEFENFFSELLSYYMEVDDEGKKFKTQKKLSNTGVSIEEYNEILDKCEEINIIYEF